MKRTLTRICLSSLVLLSACEHATPLRPKTNGERKIEYKLQAGMGIMVGEVTADSALVQVRLTMTDTLVNRDVPGAAGVVQFNLQPASDVGKIESRVMSITVPAVEEQDFIARAAFQGLRPGIAYVCETRFGESEAYLVAGPTARFQTLPGKDAAAATRFVVVTGMNYAKFHGDDRIDRAQHKIENNTDLPEPYQGPDKHLGYPALVTILKLKPHFFIGTGDNIYYDTPDNPRAETTAEMRQKWHEQFVQPRYRDLFAAVPTYWEVDDHDYRIDDGDNSGDYDPTPAAARERLLEQLPYAPTDAKDAKTYRTHRISRDLQVWFTENRMYRTPNATPDGPEKSIWGKEQREWLQRTLADSDATFKVLVSPTPMIGPDDLRKTDNHCDIGGFQHERDSFFSWLKERDLIGNGFYIVCGDRHWQYHSIDPSGVEEFSCGALIDANSRPARRPGDPKSTDPDGLVQQPYFSDPPTGGFLLVEVQPAREDTPARLTFRYHDEGGQVLHEVHKSAASAE